MVAVSALADPAKGTKDARKNRKIEVSSLDREENLVSSLPSVEDGEPDARDRGKANQKKRKRRDETMEHSTTGGSETRHKTKTTKKKLRSNPSASDVPSKPESSAAGYNGESDVEAISLSAKAEKALNYARGKSLEPTKWKFNKVMQSWLVKNYFSEEQIPEEYLDFVIKYLEGCQGGVRLKLLETCEKTASIDENTASRERAHKLLESLKGPAAT